MKKQSIYIGVLLLAAIFGCAYVYKQLHKPIDLLEEINDLRNNSPSSANDRLQNHYSYMDTLETLKTSGALTEGIKYLDILIEKDTDHKSVYQLEKGKLLFSMDNFKHAIESFSAAIRESPYGSPSALEWRAYSYINLKDCKSAILDAESLIDKDSTHWDRYHQIKTYCDSISRLETALQ
ncbi:tetratricopeptide repeat protein [Roseivirga seohaensis]|uniref:tetratricopeptide repeat protein n=1 Tax=Roseivirga seohaensis TaxID=1914963 RepID=UPI003BAA483D